MGITNIIALIGGVALFLFGMNLMGDGLKRVAGSHLEVILYKLTSTPLKGILLGTGVTAVIQSSSATSVMVVGFVNSGMMKVKQAIGIIMGAIIGTSITGWVICLSSLNGSGVFEILSTDTLTTLLAVAGIILLMFTDKETNHHIAYIFLGFAVLMFGIGAMTSAVYPLRESETFINLLTNFSNPFFGVLIGIVFTSIIQSASAAVGILQALAVTGGINFELALPIIMGIAIGASVPVLLTALGANANGKRTAFIYLMVDTFGAILFSIVFYGINAFVDFSFMNTTMNMVSIAILNTVFRVIIVLMLTPFIGFMEKIVNKLVKEKKKDREELRDVDRLEERFLVHPALAIEQTRITMNTMANISKNSLLEALLLFRHYSEETFNKVRELEDVVDTYEDKLGNYIVKIMKHPLDNEQNETTSLFLHSINDYERISDHAKNFAESSKEMFDRKVTFSKDAMTEMNNLLAVIEEIIHVTVLAFSEDDLEAAYRIAPLEEITDNMCDQYKLNHIERIKNKVCEYEHGFIFNDMLTDLERISDHCSNIGIALRMRHNEISEQHGMVSRKEIENEHNYKEIY
ncbi:MAG: Na/Pi cotransporter family protein, partial [Lachnospiraceae bacterium]|nr:Na/Pi cotransporter family protein [Lachnospiraceae bacterium]